MGKLKDWVNQDENSEFIPSNTLSLILDEVNTHDKVSIKVAGIFPITYGLLTSVSHCITYNN